MRTRYLAAAVAALGAGLLAGAIPLSAQAQGPGGWTNVGGGLNDRVQALDTDSGQLIVGGRFSDAGGNANADAVATFNGTTFGALGASGDLTESAGTGVLALATHGARVYAGGNFVNAGTGGAQGDADRLAVWTGSAWEPFCASNLNGSVLALEVIGSDLFVGGQFTDAGGNALADRLFKCSLPGGTLTPVTDTSEDFDSSVQALASVGGTLYAGGDFINQNGNTLADYVVRYQGGTNWAPMPDALNQPAITTSNVDALASDGTNLYVGTDDVDIANLPTADHIARWDGAAWSAVGGSYFPSPESAARINSILSVGTNLYATGGWADAGGDATADDVARFDGTAWGPVGSRGTPPPQGPLGLNSEGEGIALAAFGSNLILGGSYTNAGGDALADRLASFPLPAPPPPPPPPDKTNLIPVPIEPGVPAKCKKGFVRVKGKCVKKKRKKGRRR